MPEPAVDFFRATSNPEGTYGLLSEEVAAAIDKAFKYQPWDGTKVLRGENVSTACAAAVKAIVENVPPCATRTIAIRQIIDARMQSNLAITMDGAY